MIFRKLITCFLLCNLILAIFQLSSCSGGGGGGETEIAVSSLFADPYTLEVGGQQNIKVVLEQVTEDLAIKLRFPDALEYIDGSASFTNEDDSVVTNPAFEVSENSPDETNSSSSTSNSSSSSSASSAKTSSGSSTSQQAVYSKNYLVFFLTKDAFSKEARGTLSLRLRAKNVQEGGRIELDVDLDDPSINNSQEFSITNPLFEKEQAVDVRIRN